MPTFTSWSPSGDSTLTGIQNIDALIEGKQWISHSISYSFPTVGSLWSTSSSTGYGPMTGDDEPWSPDYDVLVASDKVAVRTALASWASVANLTFTEVADNATIVGDLRFAYSPLTDAQAWAYCPSDTSYAGDIWFDTNGTSYTEPWTQGSYEYETVVHEIGHTLGLKHPFDGTEPGNPTVLATKYDSRSYTIMSYSAQPGNANTSFSFEPTTPMVLDIQAIQHIYGAKYSYNATNTEYVFSGVVSYHKTIWDGGGVDTFRYNSSVGGTLDLRAGILTGSRLSTPIYIDDDASGNHLSRVNNIWIAYGTVIENAVGGSGNDILYGNSANNILNGNLGNDNMIGGLGNDTYYVGSAGDITTEAANAGIDTVVSSISRTLGANLEKLILIGTAAINGVGNAFANTLSGNAGNNILNGGLGNDLMAGGLGNDTYYVGSAWDITTEAANAGNDTVVSSVARTLGANLEKLILIGTATINGVGNALANTLSGNAGNNILNGGLGNDLMAGGLGNDVLFGGAGNDSLFGGTGSDIFLFDSGLNGTTNKDSILDFNALADTIRLDRTIFTKLAPGILNSQLFKPSSTGTAFDTNDYILYNTASGALLYDNDANGAGVAVQFATLTARPVITAADFFVVA